MLKDLDIFSKNIKGKIKFNYSLKNHTWLNIGGNAKIFFIPETLNELREFLLYLKKENNSFFIIGAGSNLLISDNIQNRIFIKLGKNFNKISLNKDNVIIAGCSILDKNVSNFACENNLSGLEFLSCIPGSIGGGIRMNSGCFGTEFKDILLSVQVMDFDGKVYTINSKNIKFGYRQTDLPKNLIFLSASFKTTKNDKKKIEENIHKLKEKKESSQPLRVKTGGSTFKNPNNQLEKKVWEIIRENVDSQISFGDAKISEKHSNFFINSKNASFKNMYDLINFVKKSVKEKTGISLELELEIVN
tara:strand:+ start:1483 stop:2391 length:909 start_codon:yes stop_codon:yes gene_type:complete